MNCKIIATSFSEKRTERSASIDKDGRPSVPYPDHYQENGTAHDFLQRIKLIINLEMNHKDDTLFDVIIANSDTGFISGNRYLESIDGTKTKNGTIHTFSRPNVGWSFGAYSDAFRRFPKYEHYLFTEDDIVFDAQNYYTKLLDKFYEEPNTGFVTPIGIGDNWARPHHAHGGVGLTTRAILNEVYEKFGKLPHHQLPFEGDARKYKSAVCTDGEVPFTNEIYNLGHKLIVYGNGKEWNMEENLCLPYYNYINS